jgi:TetR/AcrR family transcriptional regulator
MEHSARQSSETRTDARVRILQAATHLMAARGYEATSIQSIADAVGIKKQSVLYHFKSKEVLRQGVLDQLLTRWNDILPRLLMASAKSGLEKFTSVMDELMGFFTSDLDRARLLVRELLDRPDELQAALRAQVLPWVEVVARYIRMGQENGQIKSTVDPESFVLHVACTSLASLGTAQCALAVFDSSSREETISRVVTEIKRAVRDGLFEASYIAHQSENKI